MSVRRGDEKTATVLAMQDEMDALGLLPGDSPRVARYRQSLKPCGTTAAYRRHVRDGEEPCEPCVMAERGYRKRAQLCRDCGHWRKSRAHRDACEARTEAAA